MAGGGARVAIRGSPWVLPAGCICALAQVVQAAAASDGQAGVHAMRMRMRACVVAGQPRVLWALW
jgi:hypothetical protein